jgi:hypothetical protein
MSIIAIMSNRRKTSIVHMSGMYQVQSRVASPAATWMPDLDADRALAVEACGPELATENSRLGSVGVSGG